jgi:polar amino acid transport system substrate-binding protein
MPSFLAILGEDKWMVKSVRYKGCLLVLLTCSIFTGGVGDCFALSEEKVVLTTHNLYPYGSYPPGEIEMVIADGTFKGVAVDRVRCVFKIMDTPLEIQVVPWRRAQLLVERGDADGFFAASQNDSRDEFGVKTMIIANQEWNWYLLKENPLSPQDQSFKEKASVGGFVGANMLEWMQEQNYNVTATPKDTEGLLKLLLARRVDAVMANNYVMQALLQNYGMVDQVKIYLNMDKPLFVYFSNEFLKSRPMFIEKFNSLIPECSQ